MLLEWHTLEHSLSYQLKRADAGSNTEIYYDTVKSRLKSWL
jgi:hypothetical protein